MGAVLAALVEHERHGRGLGFGPEVDGLAAMILGQPDGFEKSGDQGA